MRNTRATTPPMTPPATAPILISEAEEVVKVWVVFPHDVDAAAAGNGAVDSAEDWSGVSELDVVVDHEMVVLSVAVFVEDMEPEAEGGEEVASVVLVDAGEELAVSVVEG